MDLLIIYKNPYQRAALSILFKIVDDVPDNAIFTVILYSNSVK